MSNNLRANTSCHVTASINLLLTWLSIFNLLSAQPFLTLEKLRQVNSIEHLKQAFDDWVAGKDLQKLKGWKPFRRWLWFNESRLDENGQVVDLNQNVIAWQQYLQQHPGSQKTSAGNWSCIGPIALPNSIDSMNLNGLGRINCITFHPTDSNTFWIGAASGGVWKTVDGGKNWMPLTDALPVLRISDIAVHPTDPNTLFIATGDFELYIFGLYSGSRYTSFGTGLYKSTDGGLTWSETGLKYVQSRDKNNSLIRKILIHPMRPESILVAGTNGAFLSVDTGKTFTRTNQAIINDLEMNAKNPESLIAAAFPAVGANLSRAGIYRSYDFGKTWQKLSGNNLPPIDSTFRLEIEYAPTDTDYVYALAAGTDNGFLGIYRSVNGGTVWSRQSHKNNTPNILDWYAGDSVGGQGFYDLTLLVHPQNKEIIYTGGVNIWASNDGGVNFDPTSFWLNWLGKSLHADQHQTKIHPLTQKIFICNDGGLYKTDTIISIPRQSFRDCMDTTILRVPVRPNCLELPTQWTNLTSGLSITEFYRLGIHKTEAGAILGGSQDNGTYRWLNGKWQHVFWGDGMETVFGYSSADYYFCTQYDGDLNHTENGGQTYRRRLQQPILDAGDKGDWVTPYLLHPDSETVIYGGFIDVWKSNDKGQTWYPISKFKSSGSTSVQPIKTLAIAPSNPNIILAARQAAFHKTVDGGKTWQPISSILPVTTNLITGIAIHPADPARIWIAIGGWSAGKKVYYSADTGSSWVNISGTLPNCPAGSIVIQYPSPNEGVYVGTDVGVFYRNNTMSDWVLFNQNLPAVVISEMEIHYPTNKLRAATYGRGIWESDLYEPSILTDIQKLTQPPVPLKAFPNPATDKIHIQFSIQTQAQKIQITDLTGKVWLTSVISENELNNESAEIIIQTLPSGIYFIELIGNSGTQFTRFVKY